MSSFGRWLLAAAATVSAAMMIAHSTSAEPDKRWFSLVFAAFCLLVGGAATLKGRAAQICGRLVSVGVLAAGIGYLLSMLVAGPMLSGSTGEPSALNALLFLLVFGIPAARYLMLGRLGLEPTGEPPTAAPKQRVPPDDGRRHDD